MSRRKLLVIIAATIAVMGSVIVFFDRRTASVAALIAPYKVSERTDYFRIPGAPSERIRTVYMAGVTPKFMRHELAKVYSESKGWKWGGFDAPQGDFSMGWASKGTSTIDVTPPYLPAWNDPPWPRGTKFIVRFTDQIDHVGEIKEKLLHGGRDPFVPVPQGYGDTL